MTGPVLPFQAPAAPPGGQDDATARLHVVALEGALASLRRAADLAQSAIQPAAELGPIARALALAHRATLDAIDVRRDPLEAVRSACVEVDRTVEAARGLAQRDEAAAALIDRLAETRRHLGAAEGRLTSIAAPQSRPAAELLASDGTPRLHVLRRPSLVPAIRVPEVRPEVTTTPGPPLPKPSTFEELDAMARELEQRAKARLARKRAPPARPTPPPPPEPPPGFVGPMPAAATELDFVRDRTRECLEDVAMIGSQRAPLLGDPWRYALVLERRMCAAIDAIASMGAQAVALVEPLVLDAPAKDASRVFAAAMVLGCFDGRDALAAVERIYWTIARTDPASALELAAALRLVPHPDVARLARVFLAESDAVARAIGIDVLGYRGLATESELVAAASDPAPRVAATALPWLGRLGSPSAAEVARAALSAGDPEVRSAAWLALALSGDRRAPETLARALASGDADVVAPLLAITGDGEDAAALLALATEHETPALVTAVGWAGAAAAIEPLIGMLEGAGDPTLASAIAHALERITGAGLWEDVPLPAEEIMVDEPPDPDVGEPKELRLVTAVSDPRDLPAEPAPDIVQQPTTDAARWRAWWSGAAQRFDARSRYRRGRPFSAAVALEDLDQGPNTPSERRMIFRELVARTNGRVRFDPHDFVVVQEQSLAAWAPIAARASESPGRWTRTPSR